jgi:hypothetical protein
VASSETLSAAIGKSKVDGSPARTVARICRADLIVIDDIVAECRRRRRVAASRPVTSSAIGSRCSEG